MDAFWKAFILIFMAELGDKTQFMTLAMATKHKSITVIAGVILGTLSVSLLSVALGATVGRLLPMFWIGILAGIAFLTFGILELKGEEDEGVSEREEGKEEASAAESKVSRWGPVLAIAGTFFLAELGDKTMLATVAIATRENAFVQVWLGSTMGLVTSNALAIFAGKALGNKISANTLRYAIAAVFMISGVLSILEAFKHKI